MSINDINPFDRETVAMPLSASDVHALWAYKRIEEDMSIRGADAPCIAQLMVKLLHAIENGDSYVNHSKLTRLEIISLKDNGYTIIKNPDDSYVITWLPWIKMETTGSIDKSGTWNSDTNNNGKLGKYTDGK